MMESAELDLDVDVDVLDVRKQASTGSEPLQFPQGQSVVIQQSMDQIAGQALQALGSHGVPLTTENHPGTIPIAKPLDFQGAKAGGSVFVSVPVSGIPPSIPPAPIQPVPDIGSKLDTFWQDQLASVQNISDDHWKNPEFPLARIKKIMRMDEEVRMISAEVPMMFSKAVEIFIAELSMRAWQHTEESKRRTIQRSDIAIAITKNDMFDFLIDIVPREEILVKPKPQKSVESSGENLQLLPPDLLQMFIQHLTPNASGEEDGATNVLQNQLQILQQLLHIQQLQEQQEQVQAQVQPSTTSTNPLRVSDQQADLPMASSASAGAILDTQVLQASDTANIGSDILEQLRNQAIVPSGDYQALQRLSAADLLNTATTMQQPEMAVSHTVGSGTQFQAQPVSIQHQLDTLTNQALHAVHPFTPASTSDSTMAQLPAEFGSSVDNNQSETVPTVPCSVPTSQQIPNPIAFKSTPLRLTHVHGSSSLVELSNVNFTSS